MQLVWLSSHRFPLPRPTCHPSSALITRPNNFVFLGLLFMRLSELVSALRAELNASNWLGKHLI